MQQPFLGKFILRTLFLLTPFFLYVVLYVVCDPFKVLCSYASFYDNAAPAWVNLNADYVSAIIYYLCFLPLCSVCCNAFTALIFPRNRNEEIYLAHLFAHLTAAVVADGCRGVSPLTSQSFAGEECLVDGSC